MTKGKRRGGHEGGHGNSERWLLTYADLITLLTVLFMVLWAISTTDVQKAQALGVSLAKAFSPGIFSGKDETSLGDGGGGPQVSHPFTSGAQRQDFQMFQQELTKLVQEQGLSDSIDLNTTLEGTVISLSGSLLFPSGRAELRPEARVVLDRVAGLLRPLPYRVRIEGHTDDLAPSASPFSTNWELSSARSLAVLRYFLTSGDIAEERFSVAAYSQFSPVAANDDLQGRLRNRRADIVILYNPLLREERTP